MKKIILALTLLMTTSSAFALNGYVSRQWTCGQLQSIVQRDGEITIFHRIGSMTFYANKARCDEFPWRANVEPGYEPARDTKSCFVGWECIATGF